MSDPIDFMFATIPDFLKDRPQSTEVADKLKALPESASVILHTFSDLKTHAKCWYKGKMLLEIEIV